MEVSLYSLGSERHIRLGKGSFKKRNLSVIEYSEVAPYTTLVLLTFRAGWSFAGQEDVSGNPGLHPPGARRTSTLQW